MQNKTQNNLGEKIGYMNRPKMMLGYFLLVTDMNEQKYFSEKQHFLRCKIISNIHLRSAHNYEIDTWISC